MRSVLPQVPGKTPVKPEVEQMDNSEISQIFNKMMTNTGCCSLKEKEMCINVSAYFDCEVSSEWASDSQDFFI